MPICWTAKISASRLAISVAEVFFTRTIQIFSLLPEGTSSSRTISSKRSIITAWSVTISEPW